MDRRCAGVCERACKREVLISIKRGCVNWEKRWWSYNLTCFLHNMQSRVLLGAPSLLSSAPHWGGLLDVLTWRGWTLAPRVLFLECSRLSVVPGRFSQENWRADERQLLSCNTHTSLLPVLQSHTHLGAAVEGFCGCLKPPVSDFKILKREKAYTGLI